MAAHTAREEEEEKEEGDPRVPAGSGRGGSVLRGSGSASHPPPGATGRGQSRSLCNPPRIWGFPWDFHGGFSVLHFLFDLGQGHVFPSLEGKNKIIIKNHFF